MNILGLRRHFTSPLSFTNVDAVPTSPSNVSNQDSQDNKDVLLQRLNDLVVRLSHDDAEDAAITALHKKTDEMETLLRVEYSMDLDPKVSHNKVKPPPPRRDSNDVFWGRPLNTRRESYLRRPSSPAPVSRSASYNRPVVVISKAAEIATSAEELNVRLAKAVGELQASRIESDKILAWHVAKLEVCTEEITNLEEHISNLQEELETSRSLLNRTQIDMQTMAAKHAKALDDITWREDWDELNQDMDMRGNSSIGVWDDSSEFPDE
ncbi:hypothetical protein sscle_03g022900 [Sclerotinia sclerotiorum 1980 UF-70]|uniref:Uncharacterized protein n=1 Tax=Sclerotinia sclerotiorum (strain ATCC 18683 / 1980 / Ss-1) TaxID=665079 RepID=A0A1D9PXV4_SCLS1|nr:hypothetical protein sscle_03g022900 [Sclerotinia sclerotiorum 1980 UF-70]